MIKPILLVPERHWDALTKEALLEALPMLHRYGYDTYCIEMASSSTQQVMIETIDNTIKVIEGFQSQIKPHLDKISVTIEQAMEMSCNRLAELFYQHVSSTKNLELALLFKEFHAHRITKKIFEKILSLQGSLRGFDLTAEKLSTVFNENTAFDLGYKADNIKSAEVERIASFLKCSLDAQNEGRGVIFVVGQSHYENYLAALKKVECLNEVIVIHPHSHRTFYDDIEDRKLIIQSPSLADQVVCFDRRLYGKKQIPEFVEDLEQFLKARLAKFYTDIPSHAITQKIEKAIGVKLIAKQRPSFFVDCMHTLEEGEDDARLVSKLSAWGIFSTVARVDQKKQWLIPRVNDPDVSRKISQLK